MSDPIESLIKGVLQTAEMSVRSLCEAEWTAEEHAAGRPMQEFFRSAARGLADTMSSVRASIPEIEPGRRSAQSAMVDELDLLRNRQDELEEDQDELAELVDRLSAAQRQRGPSSHNVDEPLNDHLIRFYRFITAMLIRRGVRREQIRLCIQGDGAGLREVRRHILKARRNFGQAEVEAVRDFIIVPSVFSILFTCVEAEEQRLRERSGRFDA